MMIKFLARIINGEAGWPGQDKRLALAVGQEECKL
jgi:hypothetical protein